MQAVLTLIIFCGVVVEIYTYYIQELMQIIQDEGDGLV